MVARVAPDFRRDNQIFRDIQIRYLADTGEGSRMSNLQKGRIFGQINSWNFINRGQKLPTMEIAITMLGTRINLVPVNKKIMQNCILFKLKVCC